jgi:hypothetical protein
MQRIAAAKGEQHCYAHLVPILRLTRELSVATLHFINSMLRAAYSEEATASILAHMDTLALHAALKVRLYSHCNSQAALLKRMMYRSYSSSVTLRKFSKKSMTM